MRLIDADKLRWEIRNNAPRNVPMWVYDTIDTQPTAYDVDKVVKELEEWSFNADVIINKNDICRNKTLIAKDNAIDLVKSGGASYMHR